jgi:hypothetical protein
LTAREVGIPDSQVTFHRYITKELWFHTTAKQKIIRKNSSASIKEEIRTEENKAQLMTSKQPLIEYNITVSTRRKKNPRTHDSKSTINIRASCSNLLPMNKLPSSGIFSFS